ncbi:MAG: hypothetical protein IT433_04565 [Phycisphaerales bacterium]|nr:hypothetical protein [Phycisphaerales bacterium]
MLHLVEPPAFTPPAWMRSCARSESDAEAGAVLCAEAVAQSPESQGAMVVGGSAGVRWGRDLGLDPVARYSPPLGSVKLAGPSIRAIFRRSGAPRAVVAWSAGLARMADAWAPRGVRVLRADLLSGRMTEDKSGAVADLAGVGVPSAPSRPERRERLRCALGVPTGLPLIGLVGDGLIAGVALSYVLGILRIARVPAAGVAWQGTGGLRRALRHVRVTGMSNLLVSPLPPSALFPALDLAIMPRHEGATPSAADVLLARRALACGVPVVAFPDGPAAGLFAGALASAASRGPGHADLSRAVHHLLTSPGAMDAARGAALGLNSEGPGIAATVNELLERAS